MSKPASGGARGKLVILAVLFVLHAAVTLALTKPGYLSIDEGIYHQMTQSFARSASLEVWNGYDELASEELVFMLHRPHDGRLLPQYPYLHPVLAAPFYMAAGYRGLFYLNSLAFLGVGFLCFAIARRLTGDRELALNAVLILVLATFAWEYSQAAWPHALAMLFAAGAVWLTVAALQSEDRRRAVLLALGGGLVAGFGAGVRIDVFFVLPALVIPFLFSTRPRLAPAAAAVLGVLPGLAALSITNHAKFGVWSPFSYGTQGGATSVSSYVPLALLGLAGLAALWGLTRPRALAAIRARPWALPAAGIVLAAALAVWPTTGAMLIRLADGAWQLLVDFRGRDLALVEPALERAPDGGMVYMGALKKSLLQSLPWLPLLALPLARLARGGPGAAGLAVLFLAPAAFIGMYSFFAWHGGLSLNLRYFTPTLPFLAILGAMGWRELTQGLTQSWRRSAGVLAALSLVFWGVLIHRSWDVAALEPVMLTLPLVLAAALAIGLIAAALIADTRIRAASRGIAVLFVTAAMAWSAIVALTYDYPVAAVKRHLMLEIANETAPLVESDSILLTHFTTPYFGLFEHGRVRLAIPPQDDFRDFRALIDFHLDAGRAVYVAFDEENWLRARDGGHLDALTVTPLQENAFGTLTEIRRPALSSSD